MGNQGMRAAYGGFILFEKKVTIIWKFKRCLYNQFWCLCLLLVNKLKMERIIVFMKNCELAFWKKGMFFGGRLQRPGRISHVSENFGFRCYEMPLVTTIMYRAKVERIILFMKIMKQYPKRKWCFSGYSYKYLASESNLSLPTGLASRKVSFGPRLSLYLWYPLTYM